MDWTGQVSIAQSTVSGWLATSLSDAQAKAKHAHLDNKLNKIHAAGNGPQFSESSRLQRSEQGRAGLSVAFMDMTTDYAVQEEQEDIEVWHFAHAALPTYAHAFTVQCIAATVQ